MPRITVSASDSAIKKLDELANIRQASRSQMVSEAIDSFVSGVNQYDQTIHKTQIEMMQLKNKLTSVDAELSAKNTLIESARSDMTLSEEKIKQLEKDLESARYELEKHQMAIKAKDDEINWLRGHAAQLTQSLAALTLPPGQEEKKNEWSWRFWR